MAWELSAKSWHGGGVLVIVGDEVGDVDAGRECVRSVRHRERRDGMDKDREAKRNQGGAGAAGGQTRAAGRWNSRRKCTMTENSKARVSDGVVLCLLPVDPVTWLHIKSENEELSMTEYKKSVISWLFAL